MILVELFKTVMKLSKKGKTKISLFILEFLISLSNIKDFSKLIIWKYTMNKLIQINKLKILIEINKSLFIFISNTT